MNSHQCVINVTVSNMTILPVYATLRYFAKQKARHVTVFAWRVRGYLILSKPRLSTETLPRGNAATWHPSNEAER